VSRQWDAIVVGAGAAGLSSAAALAAAGRSVVVVEARGRPGGRILTLRLAGEPPIEAGAQVVHGETAATWDVVRAAGLPVDPMPTDEAFGIVAHDRRYEPSDLRRAGLAPPWVVEQQLMAGVEPPAGPPLQRAVIDAWLSQVWCADPRRLSPTGMAAVRGDWRSGQRNFVLTGGYDGVVAHLARDLDVRCSAAAERIVWRGSGGVTVITAADRLPARAAVITVPPPVVASGDLAFDPPLPAVKREASTQISVGDAISVVVELSTPLTRSGWALTVDDAAGFWRVRGGSRIVLGSFKGPGAGAARALLAEPDRLLATAATCFPWLEAAGAAPVAVVDWGEDPWSRGGFCHPSTGGATAQSVWARPVGRSLFFAGDTTVGTRHPATVHGAIESGRRAAREVLAML
jgi:monoamine oxidase